MREEFRAAKGSAFFSDMRAKVGCVVVDVDGFKYGGCNRRLDSRGPVFSIHAEEDALLAAGAVAPREVFLYRETKGGRIADSKPCPRCLALLEDAGVIAVHFTSSHGPHFRRLHFANQRA